MKKLFGKNALIIGGTRGIGLATARLFIGEGARVAVTGRDAGYLAQAAKMLGENTLVLQGDAGSLNDIDTVMTEIDRAFGRLDVLFLNAARIVHGTVETLSPNDFDTIVEVNLKGTFFALQRALPLFTNGGSIIVTTSISNRMASPNNGVYAGTKAALRSLVQAWAVELSAKSIRINAVCPGPVGTAMFEHGLTEQQAAQRKVAIETRSPLKRMGTDEDVAKAVLFLASDDSSYVLGHELVVDGGISLVRPVG